MRFTSIYMFNHLSKNKRTTKLWIATENQKTKHNTVWFHYNLEFVQLSASALVK